MLMLMKMMIEQQASRDADWRQQWLSFESDWQCWENYKTGGGVWGTEMRTNRCAVQVVMNLHMTGREVFQVCLRSWNRNIVSQKHTCLQNVTGNCSRKEPTQTDLSQQIKCFLFHCRYRILVTISYCIWVLVAIYSTSGPRVSVSWRF